MKKRGHCTYSGSVWSILTCARRTNSYYNAPSKLARTSPRRVVWIYPILRASSERFPCSLPVSSEAAGVVSIARIERPPLFYLLP